MIVRVTFNTGLVMLFGNSYKPWHMQFDECICIMHDKQLTPIKFESSSDQWIGFGGLKWCDEDLFQQQLNREGCQEEDPDNPNPRQYKYMEFVENIFVKRKGMKIFREIRGVK